MNGICTTIARRPAGPGDEGLLRQLFTASRPDLAALPVEFRIGLVDMQFRAQRSHYATTYPNARCEIVLVGSTAVGQLILDENADSVRIVDVSVLPKHRGRGIASAVLRSVMAERDGRPVCLSVWSGNTAARRLYGSLGFVRTDFSHPSTVGYVEMRTR